MTTPENWPSQHSPWKLWQLVISELIRSQGKKLSFVKCFIQLRSPLTTHCLLKKYAEVQ